MSINTIFTPQDEPFYAVKTHAAGPEGGIAADAANVTGVSQR